MTAVERARENIENERGEQMHQLAKVASLTISFMARNEGHPAA